MIPKSGRWAPPIWGEFGQLPSSPDHGPASGFRPSSALAAKGHMEVDPMMPNPFRLEPSVQPRNSSSTSARGLSLEARRWTRLELPALVPAMTSAWGLGPLATINAGAARQRPGSILERPHSGDMTGRSAAICGRRRLVLLLSSSSSSTAALLRNSHLGSALRGRGALIRDSLRWVQQPKAR